jgi:hypothetical protein
VLAVASSFAAAPLAAQELTKFDYGVRAGIGYSDNLGRDFANPIESAFYSLGGHITAKRDEGRATGSLIADLDWVDYEAEDYESRVWGTLKGRLRYGIVQERFFWVVEDDFGQATRDPFSSVAPDNAENINYFATGPDFNVRLGPSYGMRFDARYANVWYEESPSNNDRYSAGAQLYRQFSQVSQAYLRLDYVDVRFEDTLESPDPEAPPFDRDYDETRLFLGYSSAAARTSVNAQAGYSWLNLAGDSQGGPMFTLGLSRRLTDALQGDLRAGYIYNDTARDLRGSGVDSGSTLSTSDVFEDTYVGGGLNFSKHRTQLSGSIEYHFEDYLTRGRDVEQPNADDLDRGRMRVYARASRDIAGPLDASLDLRMEAIDYEQPGMRDFRDGELGATLDWRLARTLSLELRYSYYRNSGARNAPSDRDLGYDENRVWLRAEWSPGSG